MNPPDRLASPLRQRKQERARQAIVKAAHELFAERGFDRVTVADIAERAEVGRATFFRYFGDKQEVAFGDDPPIDTAIAQAASRAGDEPLGDSLPAALAYVRNVVIAYLSELVAQPEQYVLHERLVASHPELHARSLTKQRRYAEALTQLLVGKNADPDTAALAAELGMACYYAGRTMAETNPQRLVECVDAAFARLAA